MFARRAVTSVARAVRQASSSAAPVAKGPSEEVLKLQEKAKQPWGLLSAEEKKSLYRAAYGQSRKEFQSAPSDTGKVIVGTAIAIGVAVVLNYGIASMGAYGGKSDPDAPKFDRPNYNEQAHIKTITGRKIQ